MNTIDPDTLARKVRDLPVLPAVVMELIESLGNDNLSGEQLAIKLSRDQGLTAKTLRLANSSFYGMTRQIGSIQEAIAVLGLRTIRTVVTAAGVAGSFARSRTGGFDFDAFWRHAIGTALAAQALARDTHMDGDVAFTVGLLHDIGRLALATSFSQAYDAALAYQREHDCQPIEAEQAVLGLDHAAVGARIAEHWRFSPLIVEAIAHHHAPASHHGQDLVGLAHVSDNIAHALGLSGNDDELVPPLVPEIWAVMAPDATRMRRLFEQTESQFEGVCQALLM